MSIAERVFTAFSILVMAATAQGAEFEVHPSLAVSEEFTDNVFETGTKRISDYITRALPGVAMDCKAPAFNGNLNYVFDYRHYARETRRDEITHSLSAKGHLVAVENLFFLDVTDDYQRVSLDVTRDVTKESLFFNQSDRNVVTAAPYLMFRPSERTALKTGYRFVDTRYFASSGIDKTDHVAFLEMTHELSKRWSLTAGYNFTREKAVINDFSQHQAFGGFRYEYADESFVFAQAGNTWTNYDTGSRQSNLFWNAGVTHVYDTVTATVTTGVKYDEDPLRNIMQETFVNGNIDKRLKKGTLNLSPYYSEYVLTETDTLQTKKYGATIRGNYEITPKLNGSLAFTAEKYEQQLLNSSTRRFLVDSGLSYLLAEQLTVSLSYTYVDYSSPGIAADNRHVNRAMIEIKKIF